MLIRNLAIVGAAGSGLSWRLADPKGSYSILYDISHQITHFLAGNELFSRAIGLFLTDQFNGLMVGMMLGALLSLIIGGFRSLLAAFFGLFRRHPGKESSEG